MQTPKKGTVKSKKKISDPIGGPDYATVGMVITDRRLKANNDAKKVGAKPVGRAASTGYAMSKPVTLKDRKFKFGGTKSCMKTGGTVKSKKK